MMQFTDNYSIAERTLFSNVILLAFVDCVRGDDDAHFFFISETFDVMCGPIDLEPAAIRERANKQFANVKTKCSYRSANKLGKMLTMKLTKDEVKADGNE